MDAATYRDLKSRVLQSPYADDVRWAQRLSPCEDPDDFGIEYVFVVINSGMKAQIARGIFNRVMEALQAERMVLEVFGHKGKARAIEETWIDRLSVFEGYQHSYGTERKLTYLEGLPWIGPITKYHLGKNLGLDVVKPDRHLVRIAEKSGETPDQLCRRIALETRDRVVVVDTVIWRAANMGLA